MRALNKQLGEAEADYLTGTERLAALRREVSSSRGPKEGAWEPVQDRAGYQQQHVSVKVRPPCCRQRAICTVLLHCPCA